MQEAKEVTSIALDDRERPVDARERPIDYTKLKKEKKLEKKNI